MRVQKRYLGGQRRKKIGKKKSMESLKRKIAMREGKVHVEGGGGKGSGKSDSGTGRKDGIKVKKRKKKWARCGSKQRILTGYQQKKSAAPEEQKRGMLCTEMTGNGGGAQGVFKSGCRVLGKPPEP